MLSTKFPLHPTYCSRADNNWRLSWIRFWWRCRKCEKLLTKRRIMDNIPWTKRTWSKAPGELTTYLQDGCCSSHHGYRNKMILAILNLHVTPTPPTKFWLNLTYHSGADEVWRFSRKPPWGPSQISDQNYFSNSESLCHSGASHQVWAQSTLWFGRCLLKNFKMAPLAAIDVGIGRI